MSEFHLNESLSLCPSEVEAELSPRESHAGQFRLQLWQFLLLLLSRPEDFGGTIKWTDDSGEFKVYDTEELARLWGGRKGRNTMNYDKLSRSLRYYYDKGILKKVTGQRLVYRFDSDIHRRHVHQLKQGLSGVVALSSTRSSGNAATLADSPAAQHTSGKYTEESCSVRPHFCVSMNGSSSAHMLLGVIVVTVFACFLFFPTMGCFNGMLVARFCSVLYSGAQHVWAK